MRTIFALASGRSGTRFLYELLRRNAAKCVCRHETYSWSNPSMFGQPNYDRAVGNLAAVREQVAIKARWIGRQRAAAYAETSHAFLKSWYDLAPEFFPDLRLVDEEFPEAHDLPVTDVVHRGVGRPGRPVQHGGDELMRKLQARVPFRWRCEKPAQRLLLVGLLAKDQAGHGPRLVVAPMALAERRFSISLFTATLTAITRSQKARSSSKPSGNSLRP